VVLGWFRGVEFIVFPRNSKCPTAANIVRGVNTLVVHQDFTYTDALVRYVYVHDITKPIGPVCVGITRVRAAKS
jgi:hypothetical protein